MGAILFADHFRVRVSAAVLRPNDELLVVRETRPGHRVAATGVVFIAERRENRWSPPTLEVCFYAELLARDREDPIPGDGVQTTEWLPIGDAEIRRHMPQATLFTFRGRGHYIDTTADSRTCVH